jgi:hypothetical protein
MIGSVLTVTLRAVSARGQGKIDTFQTVFVHGHNAIATIALSAFTNGEEDGRMGVATAIVTKAGVVTAPGRTDNLPLNPIDIMCNQIYIPKCSFVTFRLGVEMAEGIALGTVFVEDAQVKLSTRTKAAWIVDKDTGRVVGFHNVAFPVGTDLPNDALVLRRFRECAATALGRDVRSLSVYPVTRQPAVIAAGLVVDQESGRVKYATRHRARPRLETALRHGN